MASINLGKIALKWRGAYNAATTYASQDIVSFQNSSHICLVDGTVGEDPNTFGKWEVFAAGIYGPSFNANDILTSDGANIVAVPAGTAGQVLAINAGGIPEFQQSSNRPSLRVKKLSKNRGYSASHARVIMENGDIRTWGANATYHLGIGPNTATRTFPSTVAFPPSAPAMEFANSDYANNAYSIDVNGDFWAWGSNDYGTIGNGTTNTDVYTPICVTQINNPSNSIYGKQVAKFAAKVSTDQYESAHVLCTDGTVHACGYNAYGQLGDGLTTDRNWYNQVSIISNVVDLQCSRARYTSVFALNSSGEVYSWGYGAGNILGHGSTSNQTIPNKIQTLNGINIVKMSVAGQHAGFVSDTGDLYMVGEQTTYGNLGTGDAIDRLTPVLVMSNVQDVYCVGETTVAMRTYVVKTDGTLWACGSNSVSALGVDNTVSNYLSFAQCLKSVDGGVTTSPITDIVDVEAKGGGTGNIAIVRDSNGVCWSCGYGGDGSLGIGTSANTAYFRPVLIHRRTVVDHAITGSNTALISMFLLDDGQLYISGTGGSNLNTDDDGDTWYVPGPVIF